MVRADRILPLHLSHDELAVTDGEYRSPVPSVPQVFEGSNGAGVLGHVVRSAFRSRRDRESAFLPVETLPGDRKPVAGGTPAPRGLAGAVEVNRHEMGEQRRSPGDSLVVHGRSPDPSRQDEDLGSVARTKVFDRLRQVGKRRPEAASCGSASPPGLRVGSGGCDHLGAGCDGSPDQACIPSLGEMVDSRPAHRFRRSLEMGNRPNRRPAFGTGRSSET